MNIAEKLNQRINIEQRSSSTDSLGQPVESWALVAAVWSNISYPSGLSSIKSGADVSIVKASIRIRFRSGIDAGMRIVHSIDVFNILAVLPNRQGGYIDLVCELVK